MSYYDTLGMPLSVGDLVKVSGITNELFQVKNFSYPASATIRNILPGGRLGPSTVECRRLVRQVSNPTSPPAWWDGTYEEYEQKPVPGSVLPCGCFLRTGDVEPVLCKQHLIEVNGR